jgi:long-chain acyl-CoA synthetase
MLGELPVYKILKDAAWQWPGKPAIYDEYGMLTFGQLYAEAETLRLQLLELGITTGMGVGIKAKNGRNFIISLFAVVGCGALAMPMSPQLKQAEIKSILADAKLHILLDDLSGTAPILAVSQVIKMNEESFSFSYTGVDKSLPFAAHVNNPAFMRFTSGTTGKSKGVIVSHQAVIERIEGANKGLQLGPGDTVIWILPMAYHFIVSIALYVRFGAAIAVGKDFLAKNIIDITNKHSGTLLYASPMQIRLLANDKGLDKMPSLKKVISTSAGIAADICHDFKKRFNINVSQAYGIIEIGLPILNNLKSPDYPEAVGYALPDYTVAILDDEFNLLPDGSVGHLGIKGPGMFDAYLLPPTPREDVLKNGYFLTADYASKTADGLIKIEGRAKSVINVSGIKVFPEEVEAVLEMLPQIKLARISSSPHPLLGQIIEGEIVLQEGATVDIEEVLTFCKTRLSNFKAPQRLKIVASLPVTKTGKLQRY